MDSVVLRAMRPEDADALATLIHRSTNAWYAARFGQPIFSGPESDCRIFPETYGMVDAGEGIVAEDASTGALLGSCFLHPRPTHIGVGIVNVDPASFGRGVARRMIEEACRRADAAGKPLRLVSSAMNLDSYSLYTRAGFVPRALYQDMVVPVPESGLAGSRPRRLNRVRPARMGDVEAMAALEQRVAGVRREVDLRHFVENPTGIWSVWICTDRSGEVSGWIACSAHPASRIAGPGAMTCVPGAEALLWTALDACRGTSVLALVPADRPELVAAVAGWGGRNVELHVAQVRGSAKPIRGVHLPAFLPESG